MKKKTSTNDNEPENPVIVESPRSGYYERDGYRVEVAIYRLEEEAVWSLEVIDEHGTSTVWNDAFASDEAAWSEFLRTIDEEGIAAIVEPPEERQTH